MILPKNIPVYKLTDTEGIMDTKLLKLFKINLRTNKEKLHLSRQKFITLKQCLFVKMFEGARFQVG